MNNNRLFLISLAFALAALCFFCLVLSVLMVTEVVPWNAGISLLSVGVDLVVGTFTIWGLYWAGTQFSDWSTKPRIRLIIGCQEPPPEGVEKIHTRIVSFPPTSGRELPAALAANLAPVAVVPAGRCGTALDVYLTNDGRKAARNVVISVMLQSSTPPAGYAFRYYTMDDRGGLEVSKSSWEDACTVPIPLDGAVVLYENCAPVWIGRLWVYWPADFPLADLPHKLTLDYVAHSLEGSSTARATVVLNKRSVRWSFDY